MQAILHLLVIFLFSPLILGIIVRVKALVAGRKGPPLVQVYRDLAKLLRKGAVISSTTSWLFPMGPIVTLACMVTAACLVPCGAIPAFISFPGDALLFVGLMALARFMTVLAAMDTGSSFEGMGASREVTFAAFAEPTLLIALAALTSHSSSFSLSTIGSSSIAISTLILTLTALFIVILAENARIPIDDPTTHLELTMIHEVMVLDHGSVDLAFITSASALKLWLFGSIWLAAIIPATRLSLVFSIPLEIAGMMLLAVVIGLVESSMARLRLNRIPQLMAGAAALSFLALLLSMLTRNA